MHVCSLARTGVELQPSTSQRGSFLHAQEPEAGTLNRLIAQGGHIKSYSIIPNVQVQVTISLAEIDRHRPGPGMADNIGQRLLGHSETFCFNHQVETAFKARRLKLGLQPGQRRLAMRVPS